MMIMVVEIRPDQNQMSEEGREAEDKNTCAGESTEASAILMTISGPRRRKANRLDQGR